MSSWCSTSLHNSLVSESQQLIHEPTQEQLRRMKEELYQDPEKTKRNVDEIRNWVNDQPHLPKVTDSKFIENFLVGNKYDVEKTKTMMDRYFCARDQKRHFFENRDPSAPDIDESFRVVFSIPMPQLTPEGYRVITIGLLDHDAHKFSFLSLIRRNLMLVDFGLTRETAIGMIAITDCTGMSLRHLSKLSVAYMKDYLYCSLDAAPLRVKGIHMVNMPSYYGKFVTFLKHFLPQKLRDRVHTHESVESLHEHVPIDVLPVELGGKGPSVKDLNARWHKFLVAHKDWFLTEGSKKADLELLKVDKEVPKVSGYWWNVFSRRPTSTVE